MIAAQPTPGYRAEIFPAAILDDGQRVSGSGLFMFPVVLHQVETPQWGHLGLRYTRTMLTPQSISISSISMASLSNESSTAWNTVCLDGSPAARTRVDTAHR